MSPDPDVNAAERAALERMNAKQGAHVEALGGGSGGRVLPPIVVSRYDPRPEPMLDYDGEDLGPGWRGPSFVLEDGARLFVPTDEDSR